MYNRVGGALMGTLTAGSIIESTWTADGFRHFKNSDDQNRWVAVADTALIDPEPPTEPEQPPVSPVVYYQVRQSKDGGKTWGNPKYFKEVDSV